MPLLPEVEALLSTAGYRTAHNSALVSSITFEDDILFGFVVEYDTVGSLQENWASAEQNFLNLHAPSLRRAEQKAWNCYSVHITGDTGSEADIRCLLAIEEDFRSTRKIARAGVASRKDLVRAFAPVLPLENVITHGLQPTAPDLKGRLHEWPLPAVEALAGHGTVDEIMAFLIDAK